MKKIYIILAIVLIFGLGVVFGKYIFMDRSAINNPEQLIGGQKDEHGCLVAAGYRWCPSTQKCQRMWEEYCAEYKDQFKVINFNSCLEAGNPIMESQPRQCAANGQTYTEDTQIKAVFNCPDGKSIDATFNNGASSTVDLILSDGRTMTLPQAISADGGRYANSDESFVFWNKGDGAFIQEHGTTTFDNCVTK